MGEGKIDVSAEPSPEVLEQEVEAIRDDVTQIASELDLRRHEFFDWRHQLRKHAAMTAFLAAGALLAIGASIGFGRLRRRRSARFVKKARLLRDAFARVLAHPERVARPRPSLGAKVLTAGVTGAVSIVAKSVTRRIVPAHDAG